MCAKMIHDNTSVQRTHETLFVSIQTDDASLLFMYKDYFCSSFQFVQKHFHHLPSLTLLST